LKPRLESSHSSDFQTHIKPKSAYFQPLNGGLKNTKSINIV